MSHAMDEAADIMARVLCATTARGVERCCVARVPSGNAAMPPTKMTHKTAAHKIPQCNGQGTPKGNGYLGA